MTNPVEFEIERAVFLDVEGSRQPEAQYFAMALNLVPQHFTVSQGQRFEFWVNAQRIADTPPIDNLYLTGLRMSAMTIGESDPQKGMWQGNANFVDQFGVLQDGKLTLSATLDWDIQGQTGLMLGASGVVWFEGQLVP